MSRTINTVLLGVGMLALGIYFGAWFASMLLVEPSAIMTADSSFSQVKSIANASFAVFGASIVAMLALDYRERGDEFDLGGVLDDE